MMNNESADRDSTVAKMRRQRFGGVEKTMGVGVTKGGEKIPIHHQNPSLSIYPIASGCELMAESELPEQNAFRS